jgi:hypothetical protein
MLDCGRGYSDAHFITDPIGEGVIRLSDQPGVGLAVDEGLLRAAAVDAG